MALRPFFLKTLSAPDIASKIIDSEQTSVLSILMDAMIEREIGKFGDAVDMALNPSQRRSYLISMLSETARDMAESNSTSISDGTLSWLVDVALPDGVDESVSRILKARSHALAFFANDDRRGYRKFYHDKFFEYFLSLATIDLIKSGQNGRILSRNILGSSFLETFGDVVPSIFSEVEAESFCEKLISTFLSYPPIDRTRKNLASLAVSALTIADLYSDYTISDIDLDDCRFTGTASGGKFSSVLISQFDCRGANISAASFNNSSIISLIADSETVLPEGFPIPQRIRDVSNPTGTIFVPEDIREWVKGHFENQPIEMDSVIPSRFIQHPAFKLLQKACRIRQYWLRRADDIYAARILDDEWWPILERILIENNLLKVEMRQASGTDARFVHVKQAEDILSQNENNSDVVKFYKDLVDALTEEG